MNEYVTTARDTRAALARMARPDAIVEACRGSGNPASLAWLAESAPLRAGDLVLDVGGGLGGPAAWLADRYRCEVVVADPVAEAVGVAAAVFGRPAIRARGEWLPFADGSFDACLVLGVLSVTDDPSALLAELGRLAPTLLSITFLATTSGSVRAGGSVFRTRRELHALLASQGWAVDAGPAVPALAPPPTWQHDDAADARRHHDEAEVVAAVADGRIEPAVIVARHRSRIGGSASRSNR